MNENGPKVEFALGSQVSPGHYFKSSFARSFVTNCRDAKSLDLEFADNGTNDEESENNLFSDSKNNHFFSLMNFGTPEPRDGSNGPQSSTWQAFNEAPPSTPDIGELDKLRKQCQSLTEENRRLAESLQTSQVPRAQMIDNVLLQTQIDTLQWQLKQTEANRQMYRSLMGQIVRFLERARKSLDILHEKSNPKGKISRVPRSRSVQGIDERDDSIGRNKKRDNDVAAASTNNRPIGNSPGSRFTRAKSVAQISPQPSNGIRDFTWSVLRKNDPGHSTPPRSKSKQQLNQSFSPSPTPLNELNQTHEGVIYRRPQHPAEIDPDNVPPEKLSQEAFRLMRTVQSLLAMREPDLAMISSNEEEEMFGSMIGNELSSSSLRNSSFVNSTLLNDAMSYNEGCSSSERGSTESGGETNEREKYGKASVNGLDNSTSSTSTLQTLVPRARRSIDATSMNSNSGSSKTTEEDEEEENRGNSTGSGESTLSTELAFKGKREVCPTSTPSRRAANKADKKEPSRWLRSKIRPKSSRSVSSAEDESGFSSMSSFQEVGLPLQFVPSTLSPIKGCHTEVGLPEIPIEKIPHRRWSSTPAEIAAIFKRHSTHFAGSTSGTSESLSVWV
ncbi:uncharacterized protein [Venturia canescens]|uniref:uncharacterized protein n=1 Tax=Venturia canescens TaxID=32260 RepID=UPI001C9CFEC0|nr:uncharacterized protein LOC122416892 [Venturia canescens]